MLIVLLTTGPLLSSLQGFSGGIPELAVVHALAWQVPRCCHSQDSPSTSGDIGAIDVACDISGYGWTPPHILLYLQLDQGVAESSSALAREFLCTE